MMLIVSTIQFLWTTMDPLDSNMIINDQSMNLTGLYRLPEFKNVIRKQDFMKLVEANIDKKYQGNDMGN